MSQAQEACPECSGRLTAEGNETVCSQCGLVVAEDRIDRGPEWRSFADDDRNRERVGAPLTRARHDRGLSTEIGRGTRNMSGRKRRRMARLRRQHGRTKIRSKTDRNKVYGFTEIRRLVSALSLPDSIRDTACRLFESAQSADLLRGRSIEGFAAAAVYAACRTAAVSRTLAEVTETARADEAELRAAYDACNRDLGLPVGPVDPREYLPRFASKLDRSRVVESRAADLLGEAREAGIVDGRNPAGVAAAALYTADAEHDGDLTQVDAAAVAGVSPVTLRSSYYDLKG
jgi:transcription initiation factor TFIIB